jgi:hypothetical protein
MKNKEPLSCINCGTELDMAKAVRGERDQGFLVFTMQKSKFRPGFYCVKCEALVAKEFTEK